MFHLLVKLQERNQKEKEENQIKIEGKDIKLEKGRILQNEIFAGIK